MATYEQDPDVVKWGLQLFDGNPYENSGYYGTMMQNNQLYHQPYCQDHYGTERQQENNGEFSAQSLQEELSQLSVAEPAENLYETVGYHTSSYGQHFYPQPVGGYNFEVVNDPVEVENIGQSDSCSSPEGDNFDQEWSYPLELIDEYDIEGEVGRRFNQMISIPHIPRINGEIPSIDEATLDHQRLLHRLQLYELTEVKVQGDGNCQFRALSDQFYRTPEHHKFVRQQIINQLRSFPDNYEAYVPMAYNDYLKKMSKNGEWGDHVTLQAAADSYGVKIFVITSFKDTCYIEILPSHVKSERVICLSFWAEVHYNSVYPEGDMHKRSEGVQDESWESQDNYD